jgi:ribosomal protein S18 acetylase RimI-like enzyme
MSLQIRPWTESDLPAVREITWETWVVTYGPFIPQEDLRTYFDEHYALEALSEFLKAPVNGGFLALADDTPAGYLRTHWEEREGRFYVSSLYVLPSYQGQGLGGKLMVAAEGQAKERGAEAVWLGVMEENRSALQWYRRLGFSFVEEAPFQMGNSSVNHFIGFKKIVSGP